MTVQTNIYIQFKDTISRWFHNILQVIRVYCTKKFLFFFHFIVVNNFTLVCSKRTARVDPLYPV